jgi:hypothetical protein
MEYTVEDFLVSSPWFHPKLFYVDHYFIPMDEIIEAISSMDRCPFCGSELKRKYNTNPQRLITLNGEYSILWRVSRCSNSECEGYE